MKRKRDDGVEESQSGEGTQSPESWCDDQFWNRDSLAYNQPFEFKHKDAKPKSQPLVVSGSQEMNQADKAGGSALSQQSSFEIKYCGGHFYTKGNQWQYSQPEDTGKPLSLSTGIRPSWVSVSSSLSNPQEEAKSQSLGVSGDVAEVVEKDSRIEELEEQLKPKDSEEIDIRKTSIVPSPKKAYAEDVDRLRFGTSKSDRNAGQGKC
ncbi:MAG: hypothetical protein K0R98_567 [Rickettsiaceae bacterium]|jgi:hypothetical protein|nr:hypothetical protein [Rickettsiaceae bacterium]